jgi:hypothetical protein
LAHSSLSSQPSFKQIWENHFQAPAGNLATYPNFFTDPEAHIRQLLPGKSQQTQAAMTQEFQRLRANYPAAGNQTADDAVNGNVRARRYLVSAVLDNVSLSVMEDWGKLQNTPF